MRRASAWANLRARSLKADGVCTTGECQWTGGRSAPRAGKKSAGEDAAGEDAAGETPRARTPRAKTPRAKRPVSSMNMFSCEIEL